MEYQSNFLQLIKLLFVHLERKRKVQLFFLFILMLFSSIAEIVSLGLILPFLGVLTDPERIFNMDSLSFLKNFFSIEKSQDLLMPLTVLFCFGAIISGVLRLACLYVLTRLGHAIGADLSYKVYNKTLSQPYYVHLERNSSEVIAGISTKTTNVIYFIIIPILNILSSLLITISIGGFLLYVDPNVAISVFVIFSFLYFAVVLLTKNRLRLYGENVSNQQNQVIKNLQEGLGGIRYILIDGVQDVYARRFRISDLAVRRGLANIQIISGSPKFLIESLGMVLIVLVAFFLSQTENGLISVIPILGAFALGAQKLLPVLQLIFSSFSAIRGGIATLNDVLGLLNQSSTIRSEQILSLDFENSVSFEKVSFKYKSEDPLIIKEIDLKIDKGDRVGFIGPTGSGKTTLLDLFMGLLDPYEGSIKIDGRILNENNIESWQKLISHVPQNIFLTDGSIKENIAFGVDEDEIDLVKLNKVIEDAYLSEMIRSLDRGFEDNVGERGMQISGGQLQRIGIARALYKGSEVIVLDEATSALDSNNEMSVIDSINNIGSSVTVLMVAHRIGTLKGCNKIFELKDGNLSEAKSFEEIMS